MAAPPSSGPPLDADQCLLALEQMGVLVVEPGAARSQVAEPDLFARRYLHAHAAGAVAPADEFVHAGRPVVERADHRHRTVVDVVGQDELNAGRPAARLNFDAHLGALSSVLCTEPV